MHYIVFNNDIQQSESITTTRPGHNIWTLLHEKPYTTALIKVLQLSMKNADFVNDKTIGQKVWFIVHVNMYWREKIHTFHVLIVMHSKREVENIT